jgi:hypothetical protein
LPKKLLVGYDHFLPLHDEHPLLLKRSFGLELPGQIFFKQAQHTLCRDEQASQMIAMF